MDDSLRKFGHWLTQMGAIILPATSEWEVLRVETRYGVLVAYKDKRGRETWPDKLAEMRDEFKKGAAWPLSPSFTTRDRQQATIDFVAARDGLECWFCEYAFLSAKSREVTVEHLLAKAHGGPNHISNLVIACDPCNAEAGILSVSEKVKMRDRLRAQGGRKT